MSGRDTEEKVGAAACLEKSPDVLTYGTWIRYRTSNQFSLAPSSTPTALLRCTLPILTVRLPVGASLTGPALNDTIVMPVCQISR